MEKIEDLKKLGTLRKSKTYPEYANLAQFHDGVYETDWVSPYTKSACNVNSAIFLVLQDWASADFLSRPEIDSDSVKFGHTTWRPTNRNLKSVLKSVYSLDLSDVFATNLFPYVKSGDMSKSIPQSDLNRAFDEFCWPQVRIVSPKLVVCLGSAVFNTFVRNLNPSQSVSPVGSSFAYQNHVIYHQHHPAARGVSLNQLTREWRTMKEAVPLK